MCQKFNCLLVGIRFDQRNCVVNVGHTAPYGAFPWQVEIQIFNYEKGIYEHHCGAAVIGKQIRIISLLKYVLVHVI